MEFLARTASDGDSINYQPLKDHLVAVAALSASFAQPFGGAHLAEAAGLLHDVGKYSAEFQQRIRGAALKVDHSTAGSQLAVERYKGIGYLLAYGLMGHHGGLPNAGSVNEPSSLTARLQSAVHSYSAYRNEIELTERLELPWRVEHRPGFSYSMLIRMLFSCLVDADRLDSERFGSQQRHLARESWPSLQQLATRLTNFLSILTTNAVESPVNRERDYVLRSCRRAAEKPKGLFTLTVPTGGGKTLSSLAFALRHAQVHNLRRVIYVIPFTSIIEQTARQFRLALGDDAVLEHHSNYVHDRDDEPALSLAVENWDAPIIVTTTVQFFESLFSNKPSRCRKLHNIAESVVILDEAQSIPDAFLKPCLAALEELTRSYESSIVFCTATQPELTNLWPMGSVPDEIISDPNRLYTSLKRVKVNYVGAVSDTDLAESLRKENQVLCIVNTRKHARDIYDVLGEGAAHFHLSARMCSAHRQSVLEEVRERLSRGETCRVVSTQLIEAGVDIDFPVVWRATSGIDSIAQAAGRCNREGRREMGQVYVFEPEGGVPRGWFRRMAELGRRVLEEADDPLSLTAVREFFRRRFILDNDILDKEDILAQVEMEWQKLRFPFEDISKSFKLIDDLNQSIVIPYGDCPELLREVECSAHPGSFSRQLQRFTVGVHPSEFIQYQAKGWLRLVGGIYHVLDYAEGYDRRIGLRTIDDSLQDLLVI